MLNIDDDITPIILRLMDKYQVPGLSLAVIKDSSIDWVRSYGVLQSKTQQVVQSDSLFQAASMSKPIAALAALRLVNDGKIDLDSDINRYLKTWKTPTLKDCKVSITLRHILSHTSGLSVHGFPGYPRNHSPLPSILEILNGTYPALNGPIDAQWCPGSRAEYSGGAFCVLQLMVQELTQSPFEVAMKELVLDPLGMFNSTFIQPGIDDDISNIAFGHRTDGSIVESGFHVYPELAAAGLWTTPSDLSRFVIGIQQSYFGNHQSIISQRMAREILSRQNSILFGHTSVGLGIMLEGEEENRRFSHTGENEGFIGIFVGYVEQGFGAAVMVNSEVTDDILLEAVNQIAKVYDFPGCLA